jgi:AhpC/TSA antioxidant enzyme
LCDRKTEFAARNSRVVFVSPAQPAQAAAFANQHGCGLPVLSDPDRRAFRALHLRRGLWSVLRPSVLLHALRALRAGFRQQSVQGDPWQQGGAAVFGPDGTLRCALVDHAAGQPLDLDQLLRHLA